MFVTTANEKKEKNYNLRNVQRCDVPLHDKTQLDFVTRNSIMFYMSGNHSVKSRQIEFLNENGRKSKKKKTNKTLCLLSANSYQPFGCDLRDRMHAKLFCMVNE